MGLEPAVQLPLAVTLNGICPLDGFTESVQAGGWLTVTVMVSVVLPVLP
jgi:hypothetical protein